MRLLRFADREVDVQNYIDNTGVQVADVVVGFLKLEKKSRAEIEQLAASRALITTAGISTRAPRSGMRKTSKTCKRVCKTLHEIENGGNETAALADLISVAVLRRHLETMDRLDIEYDFLPRESEILHLHFWDAAFTKLKEAGVLTFESEGKNKGCWVMRRAGTPRNLKPQSVERSAENAEQNRSFRGRSESNCPLQRHRRLRRQGHRLPHVEVRTAGRDFGYRKFYLYPNHHSAGFLPPKARKIIPTSATSPKSTT